jgi:GntR family transcriptional repressor for pyruvate dehydrogenase complex
MPGNASLNVPIMKNTTLVEETASRLRSYILDGSLKPGNRLPTEKELVQSLNVSRTVIREAVAQMRAEGLVRTHQGLGAFVAEDAALRPFRISAEEMRMIDDLVALVELRRVIEVHAAGLSAKRAEPSDVAAMRQALTEMETAIAEGSDAAAEDFQFHRQIAIATKNKYFVRMIDFLGQHIIPRARGGIVKSRQPAYLARIQQEHARICDAITVHNSAAAETAMHEHLSNSIERITQIGRKA